MKTEVTKRIKVEWGGVDWSKQDIEISRLLGVSRERVRQVRPQGKKALHFRQRTGDTAIKSIALMDTEGKTVAEVAADAGCGIVYARTTMNDEGKEYRHLPRGNIKYDWTLLPKNWKKLTDKVMAKVVGAKNPAVVAQWRLRHGMHKR